MKDFNKKIIMSVLTLVLTIVALGTTTFAWFSLSTVSEISKISGTITGGDGLEIRLVSTTTNHKTPWKANLDDTDVSTFIGEIFAGQRLDAVTTTNPNGSEVGVFTKMGTTPQGVLKLGENAVRNEDYLEFKIEFRSQVNGDVFLTSIDFSDSTAATFVVGGQAYLQYNHEGDASATDVHTSAAYAARISFNDVVFEHEEVEFIGAVINGNHAGQTTGKVYGQWDYLKTSKGLDVLDSLGAPITDPTLHSIAPAFEHTDLMNGTDYRVTVPVETPGQDSDELYYGEQTVRIWIEGWDADAYDSVYDQILVVTLRFEKETGITTP